MLLGSCWPARFLAKFSAVRCFSLQVNFLLSKAISGAYSVGVIWKFFSWWAALLLESCSAEMFVYLACAFSACFNIAHSYVLLSTAHSFIRWPLLESIRALQHRWPCQQVKQLILYWLAFFLEDTWAVILLLVKLSITEELVIHKQNLACLMQQK